MDEFDLTSEHKEIAADKPKRLPLRWLWFDNKFFVKMLADFMDAKPNESICWGSGPAIEFDDSVLGFIVKYWGCLLEHSSPMGAKTKTTWLINFAKQLREHESDHLVVVEAHSHPIGSQLSSIDINGLRALYDWNWEIYWVMVACDFDLGAYTISDGPQTKIRLPWGIDGVWLEKKEIKKPESRLSKIEIFSTMSGFSWAKGVFRKLRKQR